MDKSNAFSQSRHIESSLNFSKFLRNIVSTSPLSTKLKSAKRLDSKLSASKCYMECTMQSHMLKGNSNFLKALDSNNKYGNSKIA